MQLPQWRQFSCRITAGADGGKSMQLWGQTAPQARQPVQAAVMR